MARRRQDIEQKLLDKKMKPVRRDGLLIVCDEENVEETLPSGIVVPVKPSHDRLMTATIIGVGSKVPDLKRGDRVMLNRSYGQPIPHEDDRVCKFALITLNQVEAQIVDED